MTSENHTFPRRAILTSIIVVAVVATGSFLWSTGTQSPSPQAVGDPVKENHAKLFEDSHSPVGGNQRGDVTIVEFMDYNCGACRRMAPILAEAKERNPGLRVVYKEFPIRGPDSILAAKAALAAHRQGKYMEFHEGLMKFPGQASRAAIEKTARSLGLDLERLLADMEDPAITRQIEQNMGLANALGITGTPAFVVGSEVRPGVLQLPVLESLIGQETG